MLDSDRLNQSQVQSLLQRVRERVRFKHYSIPTEETYVDWINMINMECVRLRVKDLDLQTPSAALPLLDDAHSQVIFVQALRPF